MSENKSLSLKHLSTIFILNNFANFVSLLTLIVAQRLMPDTAFDSFGFFTSTINHIGILTNAAVLIIGSGFGFTCYFRARKKSHRISVLTISSLAGVIAYLVADVLNDITTFINLMIIWSIFLSFSLALNMGRLLKLGSNIEISYLQVISSIAKFLFTISSVFNQQNMVRNAIFFLCVSQVITLVFSNQFLKKSSQLVREFNQHDKKEAISNRKGFVLIICLTTLSLFGYVDIFYVYLYPLEIEVGQFIICTFLGKSIGLAFVGVTNASFGQIFNQSIADTKAVIFKESIRNIFILLFITCTVLFFISDILLNLLFNIQQPINLQVVHTSIFYSSMLPMIWIWTYFLIARDRQHTVIGMFLIPSWLVIFSCLFNWVGNLQNAMLAILISSALMFVCCIYTALVTRN